MVLAGAGLCVQATWAASPAREPVSFSYTWNVGLGRSVFVAGSHSDVGNWTPTGAVKLCWAEGNVWTGRVAIQAGTLLEYKYIARRDSQTEYCDGSNVEWMPGGNLTAAVPAQAAAPYSGKTIYYHSGWTNAWVVYRVGTNWVEAAMSLAGAGRHANEWLYEVSGIGEEGEGLEFIPRGYSNGVECWDHAPYSGYGDYNYFTTLDVFFLQDGDLFNYRPPAAVTASRIATTNVGSSFEGVTGRTVRIYLPRGYDTNAWKRYPVLYLHDGQNVFYPGGSYGSWDADLTATREISQGRMRETIVVGVDNMPNRLAEYCPPGDRARGEEGIADRYANFLIHNVRPTIDAHYRTLNDVDNTLVMGSSMGGLVSAYLGWETNVFGKIGVMSPSFWTATNLVDRIDSGSKRGIRIYMDMGTDESEIAEDMWVPAWGVYDLFLRDLYEVNRDLIMVAGCGHTHNEAAWAARLPRAYGYLLSLRDEQNHLARATYPPVIDRTAFDTGLSLRVVTLQGQTYVLERAGGLSGGVWTSVFSLVETQPWASRQLTDTNPPPDSKVFYRVKTE